MRWVDHMGKDNQPKVRQAAQLVRKKGRRATYDRVLIVTEGSKTEPNYLGEIRREHKLHTANVQVEPSAYGTSPLQVVVYAEHLLIHGHESKHIEPKAFECVCVVFDRDDHDSYHNALAKISAINGKYLNDNRKKVEFIAIPSVPCFEVWLLLHFEDIQAPIHRDEVYERLRTYLPDYEKGRDGYYAMTQSSLDVAITRANALSQVNNEYDGVNPYTAMHQLVMKLKSLKS
ncbi:RloB family protein [Methylotenera sp. G11]|uniref:RloB family protein n=1 Tax=Methylotenera sp. G11 TaxID=1506585 RepID=UPI00190F4E5C|nr:RloB family protein [Methylotenera sp. G11]